MSPYGVTRPQWVNWIQKWKIPSTDTLLATRGPISALALLKSKGIRDPMDGWADAISIYFRSKKKIFWECTFITYPFYQIPNLYNFTSSVWWIFIHLKLKLKWVLCADETLLPIDLESIGGGGGGAGGRRDLCFSGPLIPHNAFIIVIGNFQCSNPSNISIYR